MSIHTTNANASIWAQCRRLGIPISQAYVISLRGLVQFVCDIQEATYWWLLNQRKLSMVRLSIRLHWNVEDETLSSNTAEQGHKVMMRGMLHIVQDKCILILCTALLWSEYRRNTTIIAFFYSFTAYDPIQAEQEHGHVYGGFNQTNNLGDISISQQNRHTGNRL